MALTLTFLGKGGTGRTTLAIAAARHLADNGKRVLLFSQDPGPAFGIALGREGEIGADPVAIAPNFSAVQPTSVALLERGWGELKSLEARYLRSPFFKDVYGEELAMFPGLDSALTLSALRKYDDGGAYDVIVYDGAGDLAALRLLGLPEVLSWYVRRFRQVIGDSDFMKAINPFIGPVSAAVLAGGGVDRWDEPLGEATDLLEQGRSVVSDPRKLAAMLVTTGDRAAAATAAYLWGSAQQSGITVGGVLLNRGSEPGHLEETFAPLPILSVPEGDSAAIAAALPDFEALAIAAPKPLDIDVANRQVRLFLPSFDKKQVKLTQYGPEVTVEAGDQRRNVKLPPALSGRPVTGAKFQDRHLIISF